MDHEDDLEADFLAIYRIEDMNAIDGPRFFKLASRVSAFQGVMAARIAEAQEESGSTPDAKGNRRMGSSREELKAMNIQTGQNLFEYSTARKGG